MVHDLYLVLQYHAIVIANNNLEDINTTLVALCEQEIKPRKITLIRLYENNIPPSSIVPLLQNTGIKWQMNNVVDKDPSFETIIDSVIVFCKTPYYSIFFSDLKLPEFTSNINKMVKEAIPFVLIKGNSEGSGQFIHTMTHRILKGNKVEKLTTKIERHDSNNTIKRINEICPNFPK